jgi:hypothetical protein
MLPSFFVIFLIFILMSKRIKLSSLPKPLRESIMKEMGMKNKEFTSEDFIEALKNGEFAWPGGYQQYFIVDDGEALSFEAAEENRDLIIDAINEKENNGWRVVGVDVNWEDDNLFCAHTGKKIPSAYGENEEEASDEAIPDEEVKENFLSESVKRRYQNLAGISVPLNENESLELKKKDITFEYLDRYAVDIAVEIILDNLSYGISNVGTVASHHPCWRGLAPIKKDYLVDKANSILEDNKRRKGPKIEDLLDMYRTGKKTSGDPSEFEGKVKTFYSDFPPHLDDIMSKSKTDEEFVRNVIKMSDLFSEEKIVGGLAANKTVDDIASKHGVEASFIEGQLKIGIDVEMEHTTDKSTAKEIAMDHLAEDPIYYQRIKSMEKKANIVDEKKKWKG